MKKIILLIATVLMLLLSVCANAEETVFTYRAPESPLDRRYDYDNAALKLALEKTKDKWGEYRLVPSPPMNFSRAIAMLESGELENPMFKLSANDEQCRKFNYALFPVDLGIVGYRVFFVSTSTDKKLSNVVTLEQLKMFSIGQGSGWLDSEILVAAGFQVKLVPKYESLFNMVSRNRFDLFSRGINEVEEEYRTHKDIQNLTLNRSVGLYYPLPRFFFTDRMGKYAAIRVQEGLVKSYNDGSLKKLWKQVYSQSLQFGSFEKIRFFKLDNPYIKNVDDSYKDFIYKGRQSF